MLPCPHSHATLSSFPHYPVLILTILCPHSLTTLSSFSHYPVLIPTLPCPHSLTTLSSFSHYPVLIPTLPCPHSHTTLSSFPHYPVLILSLPCQGFIQDFFLGGGGSLCAGKLISCGHRLQPPRGVWGHAPPEKIWNFNPDKIHGTLEQRNLWCINTPQNILSPLRVIWGLLQIRTLLVKDI